MFLAVMQPHCWDDGPTIMNGKILFTTWMKPSDKDSSLIRVALTTPWGIIYPRHATSVISRDQIQACGQLHLTTSGFS